MNIIKTNFMQIYILIFTMFYEDIYKNKNCIHDKVYAKYRNLSSNSLMCQELLKNDEKEKIFKTHDDVLKYIRYKLIEYVINKIAYDYGIPKLQQWKEHNYKYYLYYNTNKDIVLQNATTFCYDTNTIYCLSDKFLDICKEIIDENNIKEYLLYNLNK